MAQYDPRTALKLKAFAAGFLAKSGRVRREHIDELACLAADLEPDDELVDLVRSFEAAWQQRHRLPEQLAAAGEKICAAILHFNRVEVRISNERISGD